MCIRDRDRKPAMTKFPDKLSAELSGGSENYRAFVHRNTTIRNITIRNTTIPNRGRRQTGGPTGGKRENISMRYCIQQRNEVMRRMLHRDLMRGHKAQGLAILLLMGLLFVLIAAFFHGVSLLAA